MNQKGRKKKSERHILKYDDDIGISLFSKRCYRIIKADLLTFFSFDFPAYRELFSPLSDGIKRLGFMIRKVLSQFI